MANDQAVLSDLARVKALFQQRAIVAALGITPSQRAGITPDPTRGHPGGGSPPRAAGDFVPLTEADVRRIVRDEVRIQVRHCRLCGCSPLSRVVACTEVNCPAREPIAA